MLKKYFIAGILVWLPILIVFVVFRFLIITFDGVITLLPVAYRPDALFGFHIHGLGLILTVIIVFLTGIIATNVIGKYLIKLWDFIIDRIPLVNSIHSGVKKVLQALFTNGGVSFSKVLLVEYPRKGMWSIAFQTGHGISQAEQYIDKEMVTVFIPTTPNPTSGFLMILPRKDVTELDISVDEAIKMVISLGVLMPNQVKK